PISPSNPARVVDSVFLPKGTGPVMVCRLAVEL
ncbi:MAG: hypothetical protein ACJAQW_001392, partial [Paracoccaceae bacterium]